MNCPSGAQEEPAGPHKLVPARMPEGGVPPRAYQGGAGTQVQRASLTRGGFKGAAAPRGEARSVAHNHRADGRVRRLPVATVSTCK